MEAERKSPSSDNRLSIHSEYHNTPEEYLDCKLQSEVVDASALAANLLPPPESSVPHVACSSTFASNLDYVHSCLVNITLVLVSLLFLFRLSDKSEL